MTKKKVVVGMSGGVDSSVAAYLLLEEGYDVIGVTMNFWQGEDQAEGPEGGCLSTAAAEDAKRVADKLGIPHYVLDFKDEFRRHVMDYFVDAYVHGNTPNPCIVCNRFVKWEALLKRSKELGADYIATGHYARIDQLPNGRYAIRNSVTAAKDQTYALYRLTQEQLSHTLMPVGAFEKNRIRQIAAEQGLIVASKPDSMEICFIPDNDYGSFIERNANKPLVTGNFVKADGTVLGPHKGIIHYTVGQRKGLGLSMGHPVFVTEVRPDTNEVVIGEAEDVFTNTVYCNKMNYMSVERLIEGKTYLGKIRYGHRGEECTAELIGEDTLKCSFQQPVRAVTPGQALVLYDGEHVAGGGTIIRASQALAK